VSAAGTLHTIGHGDRELGVFLAMLREAGVCTLVDVRRHPGSRRYPHFGRDVLAAALGAGGIAYRWEGEALGGRRRARRDSRHEALRSESFRGYADHMETTAFVDALGRVLDAARSAPLAVMCAERHPSQCHRQLVADAAIARGFAVVHLLEPGRAEPARLHPAARVEGESVVYDVAPSARDQQSASARVQPDLFPDRGEPTADR
jgi:uncharacterized protein (DUF488 family)